MKVWKVFFLGLVYGWFMKWIIDEIFTKDQYRMIANENILLKERISVFERLKPVVAEPVQRAELQPVSETRQESPRPAPVTRPKSIPASSRSQRDDLKLIKGIGPQLEKKLNAAGVMTFEQMSRLTSTDLQNILGISKRVVQSADNLLSQAKKLAQKKKK